MIERVELSNFAKCRSEDRRGNACSGSVSFVPRLRHKKKLDERRGEKKNYRRTNNDDSLRTANVTFIVKYTEIFLHLVRHFSKRKKTQNKCGLTCFQFLFLFLSQFLFISAGPARETQIRDTKQRNMLPHTAPFDFEFRAWRTTCVSFTTAFVSFGYSSAVDRQGRKAEFPLVNPFFVGKFRTTSKRASVKYSWRTLRPSDRRTTV